MSFAGAMLIAMMLEWAVGWPSWLFARIGHPVTWLGRLISLLDEKLNDPQASRRWRLLAGTGSAAFAILGAAAAGYALHCLLPVNWLGTLLAGIAAWPMVAVRSLYDHVQDVATPLAANDLAEGRRKVSMIVGRDPSVLDEAGVARAAIESLAENASDGIVAPVLWGAILGLPGIFAYKAINTLDSMIAHKTPRHEAFGWASAHIDDAANYFPARITAFLFAMVSDLRRVLPQTLTDAHKHRSPNAGWPEAAMASSLGIRLSGPRSYGGLASPEPWLNESGRTAEPSDIARALAIYLRSIGVLAAMLAACLLLPAI